MSSIVQAKTGKLWMLFNRRIDSTARGLGFEPNPGGRRRLPPSPCTSHTASQSHHSGKLHMPRAQLGNPRHREPACPSRRTSTSCMIRTGTNTSNSAMTSVLRAQPRPDRSTGTTCGARCPGATSTARPAAAMCRVPCRSASGRPTGGETPAARASSRAGSSTPGGGLGRARRTRWGSGCCSCRGSGNRRVMGVPPREKGPLKDDETQHNPVTSHASCIILSIGAFLPVI